MLNSLKANFRHLFERVRVELDMLARAHPPASSGDFWWGAFEVVDHAFFVHSLGTEPADLAKLKAGLEQAHAARSTALKVEPEPHGYAVCSLSEFLGMPEPTSPTGSDLDFDDSDECYDGILIDGDARLSAPWYGHI